MTINIAEELKGLSPEEQEQRKKDWLDLIDAEVDVLKELDPQMADEFILNRVVDLSPQTVAKLSPEQRQKLRELLNQPDNSPIEEN